MGPGVLVYVGVDDVQKKLDEAVAQGASVVMPLTRSCPAWSSSPPSPTPTATG
ncbi:MAG: hypothetical protein ACHQF3_03710 [Alphaproteobacteria bacterium]